MSGLFLPGDLCDLDALLVDRVDHNIAAVRDLSVAELTRTDVRQLAEDCPSLARLLFWSELAGAAAYREWMINVGQRSAIERIAHLLCEIYVRQQPDAGVRRRCDFFLTQSQVAEATGLTQVHVNRTLQELRARGLVQLRQRELHIENFGELAQIAQFTGDYLHREASSNNVDRLSYFLQSMGSRNETDAPDVIVELARRRA
ncbi:Crp/Fnr family transcriptional regulator [Sphingopyxis terrae]|uniref:Crp/Fnr family transcriptional regulator n=1 Tax=Sphingopyxis terrae TaxID=33052 RepID=UPI0036075A78